jgi:hypothetical protein
MSTLYVLELDGKTYERHVSGCGRPHVGDYVATPFGRAQVEMVSLDLNTIHKPFYYASLKIARPLTDRYLDPNYLAALGWYIS